MGQDQNTLVPTLTIFLAERPGAPTTVRCLRTTLICPQEPTEVVGLPTRQEQGP
jgi:hypothetical protein